MGRLGIVFVVLICAGCANAVPITLLLDDKPIGGTYQLIPSSELNTGITLEEGVLITKVDVITDDSMLKTFAESMIPIEFDRALETSTKTNTIPVPAALPSVDADVTIKIEYLDSAFSPGAYENTIHLTNKESPWYARLFGILPAQTQLELANALSKRKLARLDTNLRAEDITKEDLDALGVTPEVYINGMKLAMKASKEAQKGNSTGAALLKTQAAALIPPPKETGSKTEKIEFDSSKDPNFISMNGKYKPSVSASIKTYSIDWNGNQLTKSKVVLSVPSDDVSMSKVQLMVSIPKEVAKSASELSFSEEPEIIVDDPVVKWVYKNIPQGETKDYSFTVNLDAQNFETLAAATADKPSLLFRMIMWFLRSFGLCEE